MKYNNDTEKTEVDNNKSNQESCDIRKHKRRQYVLGYKMSEGNKKESMP